MDRDLHPDRNPAGYCPALARLLGNFHPHRKDRRKYFQHSSTVSAPSRSNGLAQPNGRQRFCGRTISIYQYAGRFSTDRDGGFPHCFFGGAHRHHCRYHCPYIPIDQDQPFQCINSRHKDGINPPIESSCSTRCLLSIGRRACLFSVQPRLTAGFCLLRLPCYNKVKARSKLWLHLL